MIWEFAIQLLKGIFVPLEMNVALPRILEITGETDALMHVADKEFPELGELPTWTSPKRPPLH